MQLFCRASSKDCENEQADEGVRPSTSWAAYAALLGALPSRVLSVALPVPMFTLICFGLASAFLGRVIFNTPLS